MINLSILITNSILVSKKKKEEDKFIYKITVID